MGVPTSDLSQTRPEMFEAMWGTDASGSEAAWHEFFLRYRPVVTRYARAKRVAEAELEEVVQRVMVKFARFGKGRVKAFTYDRRTGRFRNFLAQVTINEIHDFWNERARQVGELPDGWDVAAPEERRAWNRGHDAEALVNAVEWVERNVYSRRADQRKTVEAFRAVVINGEDVSAVADRLRLKPRSVNRSVKRFLAAVKAVAKRHGILPDA